MKDILMGLARHVLTAAGSVLVAKGIVDAGLIEQSVGAVMTLVGLALSVLDKKKS